MRVLLDARALPAHRLGVAQYAHRLVEHAVHLCDLEVLATELHADDLAALGAAVHRARRLPRPLRLASEATVDGLLVGRHRPDVFHGLHYTLPPLLPMPATVTFHDETMLTMPEVHERAKQVFFRWAIPAGVRRADRVVCDSESARQGAIAHAGADPGRTHTVPLAVDHDRYRPGAGDIDLARRICPEPYVLWVGAIEPRKDVPTLLRAFARIADEVPHRLVLGGPDKWGVEEVDAALVASGLGDRVLRTGWLSEDEKLALFSAADAFAYPSIAEGFGLPVLEAMACGVPSVTTRGSACEEVAGDGALLVDVGDDAALAEQILRALGDEADRLRSAGPLRAAHFTWERNAEDTVQVWRWACA